MRILFTVSSGLGHLHPLVPFALVLRDAGHEVVFATGPDFASFVEAIGFTCFPVGPHAVGNAGFDELFPEMRGTVGKERAALHWRHVFAGYYAKPVAEGLLELAGTWRPDIVVRDDVNFGAYIAAERLGIVHAAVQTVVFRPQLFQLIHETLDDRRREVGLPPDAEGTMAFRHLFVSPFPRGYMNPDVALPSTTRVVRPTAFDRSGEEPLPDWVNRLSDRPLIYLTLGTVFNHRADIFSAFIEGLRDDPVELVVTVGRNQDPTQFGPQPENVHIERYIPQTLLFPRCSVVVTHGGSGTIMAALSQGLPMVVVPIAADQPENAERCEALGVAQTVGAIGLSAETARKVTREVLNEPSYRHRARDLHDEINNLPGPELLVGLLEELHANHHPDPI
jgi:UDP:flavonoid glycosyltransferase YjiC (YdhE family)